MDIRLITENKGHYMPLLLLADEQTDFIGEHLYRGALYALFHPDLRAACVLTDEGDGVFELQNIAVLPDFQRRGYGCLLVTHVVDACRGRAKTLMVGTGDSPMTLPFYDQCGFTFSHRIKDYMLAHYDHPIFEDGVQLFDKVYLRMDL